MPNPPMKKPSGGGHHWQRPHIRPVSYYYRHSPYDAYWPPTTYIASQPASNVDVDKLAEELRAQRRRRQTAAWVIVALLLAILVALLASKSPSS